MLDGFSDFAGSTIVHSVGGWAALAGVLLLGARKGKFGKDGSIHPIPGSNLPLATLGTFVLWLGWFGFNGGSQLALGSKDDVDAVSAVIANTNIAACAGALAAMVLSQLLYKKVDLTMVLNGALFRTRGHHRRAGLSKHESRNPDRRDWRTSCGFCDTNV